MVHLHGGKRILWTVNPVANCPLGHTGVPLGGLQIHPFWVLFELSVLYIHDRPTLSRLRVILLPMRYSRSSSRAWSSAASAYRSSLLSSNRIKVDG